MSQETVKTNYYLKVNSTGIISSLFINDIPVIKITEADPFINSEVVNLWLKEGRNVFSYVIYENNKEEAYIPSLDASIFIHDESKDVPTPLKSISKLQFIPKKDNKYPASYTVEFNIETELHTHLWSDAEFITNLSECDKIKISDIANKLAESIFSDTHQAINLQHYKILDDALAEGKSIEKLKEIALKNYQWLKTQKGLKIVPVQSASLNYEIYGNGYLVNALRQNQDAIVILESEDMFFDIDLYFSKIKGQWTIVR